MWSNITRYCIHHFSDWGRIYIRILTPKRHPLPRLCGRDIGCLLWGFWRKIYDIITAPHCICIVCIHLHILFRKFWPWQRVPSDYLNQCWLFMLDFPWQSRESNFTCHGVPKLLFCIMYLKIIPQWNEKVMALTVVSAAEVLIAVKGTTFILVAFKPFCDKKLSIWHHFYYIMISTNLMFVNLHQTKQ